MDNLTIENRLCFTLYALGRQVSQLYYEHLTPLGLTYPQYLVLLAIEQQAGLSVKKIGQKLALDGGTLTPLLKRLASQNLLVRQRSAVDERVMQLHLTSKGIALLARTVHISTALSKHFPLNEVQFQELMGQLQPLLEKLRSADGKEDRTTPKA